MEWTTPKYSKELIDGAGLMLAHPRPDIGKLEDALTIVDNNRSSHNYPLNTFQSTLRRKAKQLHHESLIAERIKRLRAIRHKLQKHTDKPIPLSQMQDIGGCRAVVADMADLKTLQDMYLTGDLKHKLIQPHDDYVKKPRYSGYRGIHLVYIYNSDKAKTYNGLKVELQLRPQKQHAWATAVEVVGMFRRELLESSEGDHVWKHFFKLMANHIALSEKSPLVPNVESDKIKLKDELRRCAEKLNAVAYLQTYGRGPTGVQEVNTHKAHYFLLELDTLERQLKITGYRLNARAAANADFSAIERSLLGEQEHDDAVLVSVETMTGLRRAYTNYFLDMQRFTAMVEDALAS